MMPNMVTMVSLPMETANKRVIFAGKDGLRWLGLKVDEQMDQATNWRTPGFGCCHNLTRSTVLKRKLAPTAGEEGERGRESVTKKSERIIETKETEQKRQAQIERGRCDKKIKRDSDKTSEGERICGFLNDRVEPSLSLPVRS